VTRDRAFLLQTRLQSAHFSLSNKRPLPQLATIVSACLKKTLHLSHLVSVFPQIFYTEQMFVLVNMQVRNHVETQTVKHFKRYKSYAVHIRY